jgi:hypothetical protein
MVHRDFTVICYYRSNKVVPLVLPLGGEGLGVWIKFAQVAVMPDRDGLCPWPHIPKIPITEAKVDCLGEGLT